MHLYTLTEKNCPIVSKISEKILISATHLQDKSSGFKVQFDEIFRVSKVRKNRVCRFIACKSSLVKQLECWSRNVASRFLGSKILPSFSSLLFLRTFADVLGSRFELCVLTSFSVRQKRAKRNFGAKFDGYECNDLTKNLVKSEFKAVLRSQLS